MICGKLYIVSTPIGNLSDMTFRAIDTLREVDLIAAEDTRHTRELLNHFDIKTAATSYHEHNKYDKAKEILEKIKSGLNVAIVTDAGTPIISDPGCELVKMAIDDGIEVTAVPGACAAINALVLSGLDARSFVFAGFLSDDNKKRKIEVSKLKNETKSIIFYISPHSLKKDLSSLREVFGDNRKASISREMTKKFEETIRGTLKEIADHFDKNEIRGEFVLVVSGISEEEIEEKKYDELQNITIDEHVKMYIEKGLSEKDAIKQVAKDRKLDKNIVYKAIKI